MELVGVQEVHQVENLPDGVVERGAGKKNLVNRVELVELFEDETATGFD